VTIQIALVDQSVSARIIVSNQDVKDSLQHHMIDLKTALNQSGLQIDQLQVQVQGGSSNLLGQYYQYQQEGFGYRLPASNSPATLDEPKTLENTGVLGDLSVRMSLVDVLV
jgi:flagellar hook-length control protein FliK